MNSQHPIFTAAAGPICSSFPVDVTTWSVGLYCLSRLGGAMPSDDVLAVIDELLLRINRGEDPRTVFKWKHSSEIDQQQITIRTGLADGRRKSQADMWRDQLMAAEVLRLHKLYNEPVANAKDLVATAFAADMRAVERALEEWRSDLETGALDRYIMRLQDQGLIA